VNHSIEGVPSAEEAFYAQVGTERCLSYQGIIIRLLLLFLLSAVLKDGSSRSDPLEVLCTGHAGAMPVTAAILKREPLTEATIIPTRIGSNTVGITPSVVQRYMRLYFPRTYQDLLDGYEFILLESIDSSFFTAKQFEWMRKGVEEGGLGGLQDRSVMSMHVWLSIPWSETLLAKAFPNDAERVVQIDYHRNGNLEVVLNEDPALPHVVKAYKDVLNFHVGQWGSCLMIPKQGADIYTWSKTGQFPEFAFPYPGLFPHIMGWRYGKGYTWSVQDLLLLGFWAESTNPYATDVMIAMMMYSTGRDLPRDVVMVHQLRSRFSKYLDVKSFIFSLMDFIDSFGANTAPIEVSIREMDEKWKESRDLYLAQDYSKSWTQMGELIDEMSGLRGEAMKLKDRALLWTHIIEWLVVSATFMMAGFGVWTLMVKKRLYRQVASTRMLAR